MKEDIVLASDIIYVSLQKAKSRFKTLGTAVKRVSIVPEGENPFEGKEVLKVSFNGEPILHTEVIESVKRENGLKQIQKDEGRDYNADKMPVLYFSEA